ncbi:MAG: glycosyltransferase family 25 protein [Rhodospirillales bacterium]|nr:glycosyltransferase family 25 protein [Rhodospirillales bacterium]
MSKIDLPPIFVINMAKDTDRRDGINARAQNVAVELTFIEAINGREMSDTDIAAVYDSAKRKRYFGRDMTKGEIGCLLSHRNIFEKMVKEDIPLAVILEDDVIFEPDFKDALTALAQSSRKWDVIRFLGSEKIYKRGCRKIAPLGNTRYQYARLPTAPGGAHGYLLTRNAAEIMLKHMQRNWIPIDTLQGRTWETGLETLVLYPAPLFPDPAAATTIGNDERFDKTVKLTGLPRLFYPLTRAWYKLEDTIGKKRIYWGSYLRDKKTA